MTIIKITIDKKKFAELITTLENFFVTNKINFISSTQYINILNNLMQEYLKENGIEHILNFSCLKKPDDINKK